eukprot:403349276
MNVVVLQKMKNYTFLGLFLILLYFWGDLFESGNPCTIFQSVSAFRYAWRPDTRTFPYDQFPAPAIIDNGDNDGKILEEIVQQLNVTTDTTSCIEAWIGNGKCDKQNNQEKCRWDGGDCCLNTCQANCDKAYVENNTNCTYTCGVNGYDCQDRTAGCKKCSANGVCRIQDSCLTGTRDKPNEVMYRYLDNCYAYTWSMGNKKTINQYCGTDPFFKVVHDPSNTNLHFPGCGLNADQCTLLPCCDDALRYGLTSQNCNNTVLTYSFFSQSTYSEQDQQTSCQNYFNECFKKNMRNKGQCCQCNEGWAGFDCTTPVCTPPCVNGECVGPNNCYCKPGWSGQTCSEGICKKCLYGICSAPEVCQCFYGYEGAGCDIAVSHPPCVHGKAIKPDVCQCDVGWTGPICDVPHCPLGCNNGYCVDGQYDAMCQACNEKQCVECYWPYRLDPFTLQCVTNGIIEFTVSNLTVLETQDTYTIFVRRLYSSVGTISADYELSQSYPYHTRMEGIRGTLVFNNGVNELSVTVLLQNNDGSEVEIFKAIHISNEIYQVQFIAKSLRLKASRIYASTPGFSMYYYDNTRFLSIPYISRIENHLPNIFSQETRKLTYFSLRIDSFLIFKTSSNLPETIIFTVSLSEQSSAKLYLGSQLIFDTGPFNCFGQYYQLGEVCCLQTKSITLPYTVDTTGDKLYNFRIDFRHKEGQPCIRVMRESTVSLITGVQNIPRGDLSLDSYAQTELRESPFILSPLINKDIINTATTDMQIIKFINTNTNNLIGDDTLQAAIQNKLVIYPRDIYGNVIEGVTNLVFDAELFDGVYTETGQSHYNPYSKRYELLLTPRKTTTTAQLTIKNNNQNIFGSPYTLNIIPGPYSLANSDWKEFNLDDTNACYINMLCSVEITLKDAQKNIVDVPKLFTLADLDALIVGPFGDVNSPVSLHETLYIQLFDNSKSYPGGLYYVQYRRYYVGLYNVYIRLRGEQMSTFPIPIMVLTNSVDPDHTLLLSTDYQHQIAGVPFTVQIQARDQFNNIVTTSDVNIKAHLTNMNVTLPQIGTQSIGYVGNGVYNITAVLYIIGWYEYSIKVMDFNSQYGDIKDTPAFLYLNSTYPSASNSRASGSGVSKAIIGRKEQVYLQVNDIFGNMYSSDKYASQLIFNLYVEVDGGKIVPVNLTSSNNQTGFFLFIYQLLGNYNSVKAYVKVWTSLNDGSTFSYENIFGSPFTVTLGVLDLELYESYEDLSLGGFGVTALSYIDSISPSTNILAGQNFQLKIEPRNEYDQNFAYFEQSNNYFLVSFSPLVDYTYSDISQGYMCDCREESQRYCKYFSHSKDQCEKLLACQWLHLDSISSSTYKSNFGSCVRCSRGCSNTTDNYLTSLDIPIQKQKYFEKRAFEYNIVSTSDNTHYFFDQTLILASSTYLVSIIAFRIGQLRMVIYENPDFTGYIADQRAPSMNLTFNKQLNPYFETKANMYSVTLQGKIRYDFNNLLNFTVHSNKHVVMYIDRKLVLNKSSSVKNPVAGFLIKEMIQYQLLDFEVFISDDDKEPEFNTKAGFFKIYQESGNIKQQIFKPKNFFLLEQIKNSGTQTITIKANTADITKSIAYEKDQLVEVLKYEKVFRAGQSFNFDVRVYDQYLNLRGSGYTDTVSVKIYLNRTLITTINTLTMNPSTGYYNHQYIPTSAPAHYTIEFYLNTNKMTQFFEFSIINSVLDATFTKVEYQGYMAYKENDCVFVNRPIYLVFDMKDKYNNLIPYHDKSAYMQQLIDPSLPQYINPTLSPDSSLTFFIEQCYQYLGLPYQIICPMKPNAVALAQTFTLKDYQSVNFAGFPLSNINILPFKQEKFRSDSSNTMTKLSSSISSGVQQILLSFTTRDIYGNLIQDEVICSHYNHKRYLLWFQFAYYRYQDASKELLELIPSNLIDSIFTKTQTESFDPSTSIKSFILQSILSNPNSQTTLTTPEQIYLNYTLLDGLEFQDGLLAKYYSNNNFLGDLPLLTSIISESFIDGGDVTTNWYRMHKEFKEFSVKITSLIWVQYDELYTFVTGFTSNFQLYVNDKLVIDFTQTSGSIKLQANQYAKIKILYYKQGNTGSSSVPQLLLNWQSSSLSFRSINGKEIGGGAIGVDIDDQLESVLVRDIFRIK